MCYASLLVAQDKPHTILNIMNGALFSPFVLVVGIGQIQSNVRAIYIFLQDTYIYDFVTRRDLASEGDTGLPKTVIKPIYLIFLVQHKQP